MDRDFRRENVSTAETMRPAMTVSHACREVLSNAATWLLTAMAAAKSWLSATDSECRREIMSLRRRCCPQELIAIAAEKSYLLQRRSCGQQWLTAEYCRREIRVTAVTCGQQWLTAVAAKKLHRWQQWLPQSRGCPQWTAIAAETSYLLRRRCCLQWLTAIAAEGHISCSDVVDSSGCSIQRLLQRIRSDCSDVVADDDDGYIIVSLREHHCHTSCRSN